jgi:hypothetical protein
MTTLPQLREKLIMALFNIKGVLDWKEKYGNVELIAIRL